MAAGWHRLGIVLAFFPLALGLAIAAEDESFKTFCVASAIAFGIYWTARAIGWVVEGFRK